MEQKNVSFEKVSQSDVQNLTKIMKRAFDEDTRRHLGRECGGPTGYDNGEFIQKWFIESGADAFKILSDGKLIGGFNIFKDLEKQEYILGCIFIDAVCEDSGYGSLVWKKIEAMYPDAVKWRTETPGFSRRNHNFYVNKCGFHVVHIDNPKDIEECQFILEKVMK